LASRAEQEKCHGNDRGASRSARYEGSREIGDLSTESVIRVVDSFPSFAIQDFNWVGLFTVRTKDSLILVEFPAKKDAEIKKDITMLINGF